MPKFLSQRLGMGFKQLIRQCIEGGLRASGYELKKIGSPLRGYDACLRYAKSRGLAPKTVFDVGVGHGTPWLYDAFPDSKLVLFEPLSLFDVEIHELVRKYHADVHKVALARAATSADLYVNTDFPTSSSLLPMDERFKKYAVVVQREHRFNPQRVSLETLDRLNNYEPPFVLKLDVEGAEMDVLEGARRTLEQTELLITEMSVMRRYSGERSYAQIVHFLDECGFQLFDIPTLAQAHDGQLLYLDAVFVPKNSRLWPA